MTTATENALGQTWVRAISAEDYRWHLMSDAMNAHGRESAECRLARKRYLSCVKNTEYIKAQYDAIRSIVAA